MKIKYVFLISVLAFSCAPVCKKECTDTSIIKDHIEIMKVCYYYEKHPEEVCEECLKMIIANIIDCRTSTAWSFTHSSVYFRKIRALESITGISAGDISTPERPDALVIDKCLKWFLKNTKIKVFDLCLVYPGLQMKEPSEYLDNYDKVDWPEGWNRCKN